VDPSYWMIIALMADGSAQGGGLLSLVPLLVIFALFYFILIAPMRRKQKQLQAMIDQLKSGDKVVTTGGLHGTVVGVEEAVVHLRIADQVKVAVSKSAIAGKQPAPGEEAGKS
jgi:preprotein translocase subunit YajC